MFAKHVLCWIVFLCCWRETQAAASLSMQNRTRVALAGEELKFSLTVTVPANATNTLGCYSQKSGMRVWSKTFKRQSTQSEHKVMANITMHNSSCSGKYYFDYANQKVHWVVEVRDKGYEEPPDELDTNAITMMAFSGVLLIFNITGSLYLLRNCKRQCHSRNGRKGVAEQSPEENENVILDEDPGSASLYTALQYKSDSIYDTLNSDTEAEERNTRKENSYIKHRKAQEIEVFDSVYENL